MDTIPVILDTDIGSDIDDAVALAYLLKQPLCELVGITTVSGEPEKRAMLADAVCRAAGRDTVPVHVGTPSSLLVGSRQPHAPQAEALTEQWPHREFAKTNTAIDFLRETIHARPGEITLLAIGPLTNLALLFTLDPEIPTLLKGLTLMGGQFYTRGAYMGQAEWNVLCDPHAAEVVFRAPVPLLTAIGLDVTTQCVLPADECRKRFTAAGGALGLVAAMAEVWFRHVPNITFHDPLAATALFEPSLCEYQNEQIEVELVSPRAQGQTLTIHDAKTRPHKVAESVRAEAFFEHYFSIVGG